MALLGLVGCGRIAFEPLDPSTSDGDGSVSDALSPDAFTVLGPCPYGPAAPDPIRISGTTENAANSNSVAGAVVEATMGVGGPVIAQVTSRADGTYDLDIPTGGRPIWPVLSLRLSGYMDGSWFFDAPVVDNIATFYSPMGQPGDVDSLYSITGAGTRDPAKGTIYLEVRDCNGAAVTNATITTSPASGRYAYGGPAGVPSTLYSSTTSSARAWALNVPAGTITITASRSGVTFLSHTMNILAGDNFMGTRLRQVP